METVKATSGEAPPIPAAGEKPAPPALGSGETPPIPAVGEKPAPVALRDVSGGMGPIPFLKDTQQAEPSQLIYTLNNLIGAINARFGLIQPSAVKPEEKHPAAHPAAQQRK
jgi:hypothetical protein